MMILTGSLLQVQSTTALTQTRDQLFRLERALAQVAKEERVHAVNDYFNQMAFQSDYSVWGEDDYWATPEEFLQMEAGDCEDFSMAKYFMLRRLGVDEGQMKLAYVRVEPKGEAHMVLAYYPDNTNDPKILDNLTGDIVRLSERSDLLPTYSFNAENIWIGLPSAAESGVGNARQLSRWQSWLARVDLVE